MLYRQLLFHYHNDIELNLIKIRLINFDFGKLLKILRVFADVNVLNLLAVPREVRIHQLTVNCLEDHANALRKDSSSPSTYGIRGNSSPLRMSLFIYPIRPW